MVFNEIHQSSMNSFLRCPCQFEFRYIKGLKIPPGVSARRGSAVHKAAEDNHVQKKQTGEDLPAEQLIDTAVDEFKRLVKDYGVFISKAKAADKSEEQRIIGEGLDQAVGATQLYADEIAPKIEPDLVEVEVVAHLPGWDMPIGGILDVVDHAYNIIDLKTMKTKNQAWADREIQPTFYSVLHHEHTGEWPNSFKYHFMVPNKTPKHIELVTNRNHNDVRRIERVAEVMCRCIESGLFPPAHPTDWICSPDFCGFFKQCRYGR